MNRKNRILSQKIGFTLYQIESLIKEISQNHSTTGKLREAWEATIEYAENELSEEEFVKVLELADPS